MFFKQLGRFTEVNKLLYEIIKYAVPSSSYALFVSSQLKPTEDTTLKKQNLSNNENLSYHLICAMMYLNPLRIL
jgi:hypothetical protein